MSLAAAIPSSRGPSFSWPHVSLGESVAARTAPPSPPPASATVTPPDPSDRSPKKVAASCIAADGGKHPASNMPSNVSNSISLNPNPTLEPVEREIGGPSFSWPHVSLGESVASPTAPPSPAPASATVTPPDPSDRFPKKVAESCNAAADGGKHPASNMPSNVSNSISLNPNAALEPVEREIGGPSFSWPHVSLGESVAAPTAPPSPAPASATVTPPDPSDRSPKKVAESCIAAAAADRGKHPASNMPSNVSNSISLNPDPTSEPVEREIGGPSFSWPHVSLGESVAAPTAPPSPPRASATVTHPDPSDRSPKKVAAPCLAASAAAGGKHPASNMPSNVSNSISLNPDPTSEPVEHEIGGCSCGSGGTLANPAPGSPSRQLTSEKINKLDGPVPPPKGLPNQSSNIQDNGPRGSGIMPFDRHRNYSGYRRAGGGGPHYRSSGNRPECYLPWGFGGGGAHWPPPPPPPPPPPLQYQDHLWPFLGPPPPPYTPAQLASPRPPPPSFVNPMGYADIPSHNAHYVLPHPMSDHLWALVEQIDYYFSVENLCKDVYLRKHMDDEGWVPISLIAGFNMVRKLATNIYYILDALRYSTTVVVQGRKIRCRNDPMKWILPPQHRLNK